MCTKGTCDQTIPWSHEWKSSNNLSGPFSTTRTFGKKNTPHTHQHVHTPARWQTIMWIQVEAATQRQRSALQRVFFSSCMAVKLNSHTVWHYWLQSPSLNPRVCAWLDSRITGPRSCDPISARLTCPGRPLRGFGLPALPHCFHWMVGAAAWQHRTGPNTNTRPPNVPPFYVIYYQSCWIFSFFSLMNVLNYYNVSLLCHNTFKGKKNFYAILQKCTTM